MKTKNQKQLYVTNLKGRTILMTYTGSMSDKKRRRLAEGVADAIGESVEDVLEYLSNRVFCWASHKGATIRKHNDGTTSYSSDSWSGLSETIDTVIVET